MFHPTCTPCPKHGTDHGRCYECACANAARDSGCNDLALELARSAIDCSVEQTGGFTMLVMVKSTKDESYIQAGPEGIEFMRNEEDEHPVHLTPVEEETVDLFTPKGLLHAAQVVRENLYRLS